MMIRCGCKIRRKRSIDLRTFTSEELNFGRKTYEIGDITVLNDGIKVQLK